MGEGLKLVISIHSFPLSVPLGLGKTSVIFKDSARQNGLIKKKKMIMRVVFRIALIKTKIFKKNVKKVSKSIDNFSKTPVN